MNRIFTTSILISGIILASSVQSQTIYIDNGSSNSYNLQNGDSLHIRQGSFTGSITAWANKTKISVATGATFRPSSVQGYRSAYSVYGTAILPSIGTGNDFAVYNYGTTTVNGGMDLNSNNVTVYNHNGSTFTIKGAFNMNSNNHDLDNYGQMKVEGNWAINSNNASIANYGRIEVTGNVTLYGTATILNKTNTIIDGNFNSSKGTLTNEGLFQSKKKITFGGNTVVTNTCRLVAQEGIVIDHNNATVYNSGLIWASGNSTNSVFTNSGTFINSGNGVLKTVGYTNYGKMQGNGYLYILGKSTLGTQGSVGSSGNASNSLKIYTVNRTNTNQVFDDQWGTVHSNATYATFAAPDTVSSANYSCAVQYAQPIILPVIWNSISANLVSDVPVINWSASFDEGTKFDVERSENGVSFSKITTIASQQNVNNYKYSDLSLSANHASVIYYRINAVEPDGTHKYSDVKVVRFSSNNTAAVAQAWPNPFTSQLNVNYKAAQKTQLTISIYNVDGKLQVVKTAPVNSGNNSIVINEASKLPKGVYIVRVASSTGDSNSSKIIKQ